MSNIHLLGSIINDLENELLKYSKKKDASDGIVKMRQDLINKLSDVYDGYKSITMWEVFSQIQSDVDKLREKDKEITSVLILLPLFPIEFDATHCAMIDYFARPIVKEIKPNTYLDKEYYK